MVTRAKAGVSMNWGSIPGRDRNFPLLHSSQTGSGVYLINGYRALSKEKSGRSVKLTTYLGPRLRIGVLHPNNRSIAYQ
jgi:hypothetical protein